MNIYTFLPSPFPSFPFANLQRHLMARYKCGFCLEESDSNTFYQNHIGNQTISFQFRSGYFVTIDRNSVHVCESKIASYTLPCKFLTFAARQVVCPWEDCIHRDCSSEEMIQHIQQCDFKPDEAQ